MSYSNRKKYGYFSKFYCEAIKYGSFLDFYIRTFNTMKERKKFLCLNTAEVSQLPRVSETKESSIIRVLCQVELRNMGSGWRLGMEKG